VVWRLLEEDYPDIFRSLAVEESLARVASASASKMSTLRLWHTAPSVVMGRFQCLHKEVNTEYCEDHGIRIARRFTGGGAVYLDEGCLNFTLCMDQNEPSVSRTLRELYWNFIGNIASSLRNLGMSAMFDSVRNSIRINAKKITGTAGWIKHGVSLIHGTVLIRTDLEALREALRPHPSQTEYARDGTGIRCMDSRRDVVTSITREYPEGPLEAEIRDAIIDGIEQFTHRSLEKNILTEEETETAESLYRERYSQPQWNLGVSVQAQRRTDTET
jgi:lipoate-protein ligase A